MNDTEEVHVCERFLFVCCCVASLLTSACSTRSEEPEADTNSDVVVEFQDQRPDHVDMLPLEDMAPVEAPDQRSPAPDMRPPELDMKVEEVEPPSPCQSTWGWRNGTTFPGVARDHHVTFINETSQGGWLHVASGTNYSGLYADHWRAKIEDDGDLSEWELAAELPDIRGGAAYTGARGRHYLLGGRNRFMVKVVFASVHDQDGNITGWEETTALPAPRFHSSATNDGERIYVSGGLESTGLAQDSLYVGRLDEDGSVTSWETYTLPEPRSHHASFIRDGFLYVVHGFSGNAFQNATTGHKDIIRTQLDAETGAPGEWELFVEEDLDISTLAVTSFDEGCVCRVGGIVKQAANSYTYSEDMACYDLDAAPVRALQSEEQRLETGRSHVHQAPYYNGHFYVVGGSRAYQDVTTSVEIAAPLGDK